MAARMMARPRYGKAPSLKSRSSSDADWLTAGLGADVAKPFLDSRGRQLAASCASESAAVPSRRPGGV